MGKSITTRSYTKTCKAEDTIFALKAIPKLLFMPMKNTAISVFTTYAACSPSPSGIENAGGFLLDHRAGYFIAFLFLLCGAARLARFNVQTNPIPKNPGRPDRKYFVGLPIPAAAGMVAAVVYAADCVDQLRPVRPVLPHLARRL